MILVVKRYYPRSLRLSTFVLSVDPALTLTLISITILVPPFALFSSPNPAKFESRVLLTTLAHACLRHLRPGRRSESLIATAMVC